MFSIFNRKNQIFSYIVITLVDSTISSNGKFVFIVASNTFLIPAKKMYCAERNCRLKFN